MALAGLQNHPLLSSIAAANHSVRGGESVMLGGEVESGNHLVIAVVRKFPYVNWAWWRGGVFMK